MRFLILTLFNSVPIQRPNPRNALFLDILSCCAVDGSGVDLDNLRPSGQGAYSVGIHVAYIHSSKGGLATGLRRCKLFHFPLDRLQVPTHCHDLLFSASHKFIPITRRLHRHSPGYTSGCPYRLPLPLSCLSFSDILLKPLDCPRP